jgi:hypothetical protein
MLVLLSIAGALVVAFLGWNLFRRFATDRIESFLNKRRSTARIVTAGEFVDGNRHVKVALALTSSHLYYENADMEASLDLQWAREIEYDSTLATGGTVAGGKVLRIRCFSQVFEFVVPDGVVAEWHMHLPPRRDLSSPAATAMSPRMAVAT